MNHSDNFDQYIKERSWVLNSINRSGKLSYNVCTQDQSEVLLVDYYPKSGRAYLHLKTLQRHNIEYSSLLKGLKTVGTGQQTGYNLSHIMEWSTVKTLLDQLDQHNHQDPTSTLSQRSIRQKQETPVDSLQEITKLEAYTKQSTNKQIGKKWTFKPVDADRWSDTNPRVLLLGAEPNGDNDYEGPRDMGEWFRAATLENRYSRNRRFFTSNIAQLNGVLSTEYFQHTHSLNTNMIDQLYKNGIISDMLSHLRYADLKAIGGGAVAMTERVMEYVKDHLEEVLGFWNPMGSHRPPTHTVIQGAHAHQVFMDMIRPELQKRAWSGFYIGMPHPSAQTISYESLRSGAAEMFAHFKPFTDPTGVRWNGDSWIKINSLSGKPT